MHGFFRWSSKWWPGLVPLAGLIAVAAWTETVPLESDLAAHSAAAVKNTLLDKTRISVSGRDVTFDAEAFSEAGRQRAVAAVEAVPAVRLVNDETRLVPEAKPFVWSVERDVAKIMLTGNAPLPASKSKLLGAARAAMKGVQVVDQMSLARGAPQHFDGAALLLIDQIGKLKNGKLALSGSSVTLSGMARELGGRERIAAALTRLPKGFTVKADNIKAPPYVFQAIKDPVARTLTLSGYVPDGSVHAAIVGTASREFFGEKVIDRLKTSLGAPYGFAGAVIPALGALSRLSTGTLEVSDWQVKLAGDALYKAAAAQIRGRLKKDFSTEWQVNAHISVKPVSAQVVSSVCQQLFSNLLAKGNILFESGGATIDPDSAGLLDYLIETALRCPTANIEIAGSSGSDGDDAADQALSEARAQAVRDYLVKAGLPADRFTVGYGSDRPAAAGDPGKPKAQNRRIEFLVR
ncbi:MAG: OmpA family protein [Bradyrhizobium sp.]